MSRFIVRRLISLVFVSIGITLITFTVSHIVPSDPARLALGARAQPEAVQKMREKMGLDRPLPEQYLTYMTGLFRGDFGDSLYTRRTVREDLADYLPASIELTITSLLLVIVFGYPLGVLASYHQGRWIDRLVNSLSVIGVAIPVFWIGIVFQLIFYRGLQWLPAEGRLPIGVDGPPTVTNLLILDSLLAGDIKMLGTVLRHLTLPAVTLALPNLAYVVKLVRANMIEEMSKDYVCTAKSKGLTRKYILWKHALPNGLLPAITLTGMLVGAMLAGAFLVEIIFNWPGIGWYTLKTILSQDFMAVISVTLIVALVYMLSNLAVDLLYIRLNPRIRYS